MTATTTRPPNSRRNKSSISSREGRNTRSSTSKKNNRSASVSPQKKATSRGAKGARKASKSTATTFQSRKAAGKSIKSYADAISFLDSLVNYERLLPKRRFKGPLSLATIQHLLKSLDHPQNAFRSVHIAGSKGKGSTAAMLAHMLSNNGLKVGLYASPHIMNVRERISIDDKLISQAAMARLISKVAKAAIKNGKALPTYFEMLTAVAFLHFADQKVDIAIIETGLGGRLDATNVLMPDACAMTNISMDHMPQLGNSLAKIAEEKAGVFKPNVPIISAPQPEAVKEVLKRAAKKVGTQLYFAGDDIRFSYRFEASHTAGPQARICVTTPTSHFDHLQVPLAGQHQAINCGVALGVLDQLKQRGYELKDELSITGLSHVRLPGRMEMLCDQPRVLADGAHNAASIEALMRAIGQNVPYDSMVVIFGCCADKDIKGMMRLVQIGADKIIFTRIKSPRSADPQELADQFAEVSGRMAQVASRLPEALEIAEKAITHGDLICITGSFYLVSQAKTFFANHPHRSKSTLIHTA